MCSALAARASLALEVGQPEEKDVILSGAAIQGPFRRRA